MERLSRTAGSLVIAAGAILAMTASAIADAADWRRTPWLTFTSALERQHPDIGRIWSVADGKIISPAALVDRLAGSRYVLVGEFHDNPDHHRLQAFIVAELAAAGRHPRVVMEMIDKDRSSQLEAFLARPDRTAAGLGDAVNWPDSGWPSWPQYQPIAEAALAAGLVIAAGDPPRAEMRGVTKDGAASLPKATVARLRLDRPFEATLEAALRQEIIAAHCNMLPPQAMDKFVLLQRLRDAHLAEAMRAGGDAGAILIAGGGHVRRDRAVPLYLDADAAVLVLVEAAAGEPLSAAYAPADPAGRAAVDFIWLTPGVARPDPCDDMRKAMEQHKPDAP